jgi:hypothetical protein
VEDAARRRRGQPPCAAVTEGDRVVCGFDEGERDADRREGHARAASAGGALGRAVLAGPLRLVVLAGARELGQLSVEPAALEEGQREHEEAEKTRHGRGAWHGPGRPANGSLAPGPCHACPVKRLAAVLAIGWLLACAGNVLPCLGTGTCVAADSCCDPEEADHGRCPPGPDCPCCPQLRPALPTIDVAHALPTEEQVELVAAAASFHASPEPREILHVPKLVAVVG